MRYWNRVWSLKVGQLEINTNLDIDWEYSIDNDKVTAQLKVLINNISKESKSKIKKGDIVEFGFGYEEQVIPFFYGLVDILDGDTIIAYEYKQEITKRMSRSYKVGTNAEFVIRDLAEICKLEIEILELAQTITYSNGYNVYDLPLMALKKIVASCGSVMVLNGSKLRITATNNGFKSGVEYDFNSGLLANIEEIRDDINSTHLIKALANPIVKKGSIIKVLGNYYKVNSLDIDNFIAEMEVLKLE